MSQIEAILGSMDRINSQMKSAVRGPVADRNRQIVTLRQEFSAETGNLLGQLPTDDRLCRKPETFAEFQERLDAMRTMLASHQAKWSVDDIDAHRTDYLSATEAVHAKISDYLDWARNALTAR